MKIVLIHCYSDNNRGDLGIIISTVGILRKVYSGCEIVAISTFEQDDPKFQTDHEILKLYVDDLLPAIVGRVYSRKSSPMSLFWKVCKDTPKLCCIFFPIVWAFRLLLFNENDRRACSKLVDANLVVSKGGSFLCSTPGIRGAIRFYRILATLVLVCRLNKNVVIWGQSLGPVHGQLSRMIFNQAIKKVRSVILREDICTSNYPYMELGQSRLRIGHDLAFNIKDFVPWSVPVRAVEIGEYVAFTIKRFEDPVVDEEYTDALCSALGHVVKHKKLKAVILPHVTIGEDLFKAREVCERLDSETRDRVELVEGTMSLEDLIGFYSHANCLVGTRLHSTIFAMSVGTPSINISYHGTKSLGVYSQLKMEQLVIDGVSRDFSVLNALIDELCADERLSGVIDVCVGKICDSNIMIGESLLLGAGNEEGD